MKRSRHGLLSRRNDPTRRSAVRWASDQKGHRSHRNGNEEILRNKLTRSPTRGQPGLANDLGFLLGNGNEEILHNKLPQNKTGRVPRQAAIGETIYFPGARSA